MIKFILCIFSLLLFKINFWFIINFIFIIFLIFIFLYTPLIYSVNVFNYFFIDNLSYCMILLRLWIVGLIFLSSENVYYMKNKVLKFNFILLILMIFLIISFFVNRCLLFYIFFEIRLIPTFILILGWGYQPERLQAGIYLLFYTLIASLPLLISIFYIDYQLNSISYIFLFNMGNYRYFYISIIMAFLVKIPMFLVHLWLPKAHVEAPISGSIILAGVLLKLGGYGLLRFLPVIIKLNIKFRGIWIILRLYGSILIRLNCLRQIDIKSLIAYSSVAHMGIVLGGLVIINNMGINGCFVIIIGHGLCSSGMFCLANVSYERTHRRRLLINKGLISLLPRIRMWWFLLRSSNIAAPPSLNLLGEIDLIIRIVSWSWLIIFLIFFVSLFRAAYCLYLFAYRQHGASYSGGFSFRTNSIREIFLIFLHWIPLNLLFLNSEVFLLYLNSLN